MATSATSGLPALAGRTRYMPPATSLFLHMLPIEIRNRIYQLCISIAMNSEKWTRSSSTRFGISVVSLLYDPPSMRIEGCAPLPLLLVNRQIYRELVREISFNVDRLRIGGYLFEYKEKQPNIHWKAAFSLLDSQPGLTKSITSISIQMPSLRDEMRRCNRTSVSHMSPSAIRRFDDNFPTIIPGLMKCLGRFENLSSI